MKQTEQRISQDDVVVVQRFFCDEFVWKCFLMTQSWTLTETSLDTADNQKHARMTSVSLSNNSL